MNSITVSEILDATGGMLAAGSKEKSINGVKHDSRECTEGNLFVAVCGENSDGHDYIPDVIGAGAAAVMISHEGEWFADACAGSTAVIMVKDTIRAMGDLAKYYLDTLNIRKVAVTGSVGKTSVRDMIYYVLNEKYNCGRNMKNYNNDIGLPLSVFSFDSSTEIAVLEMGMSGFGEIDRLAEIVKPDVGIITNIGVSHIEKLGSRDGIFKAKMELADHLESEGVLIYASGDKLTRESTAGNYSRISVGKQPDDDYMISEIDDKGIEGIEFTLKRRGRKSRITIPVPGRHNAVNSSIAIAVGDYFGVSEEQALCGLAKTKLTGRRLKLLKGRQLNVIDDTYNASTDSMKSALEVLERTSAPDGKSVRKIAILGDMFELGEESRSEHRKVGEFAGGLDIDLLIAVGDDAGEICAGAQAKGLTSIHFPKKEDFCEKIGALTKKGDLILVKGSRGMKMEQIVEKLIEYQE